MQANGIGCVVAFAAITVAALCAECIPVMFGATLVAICGVAWDFARGNVTDVSGKRKSRQVRTSHKAAGHKPKQTHPYYKGKKEMCQAWRRNT